ncbi:hypothetical protein APLC1_4762 [Limnospira platensis C1]|nr:hypothetical protein APLC1_4762 [Arthrospira platensis C1]
MIDYHLSGTVRRFSLGLVSLQGGNYIGCKSRLKAPNPTPPFLICVTSEVSLKIPQGSREG